MSTLFQIEDYARITTADYVRELKDFTLHPDVFLDQGKFWLGALVSLCNPVAAHYSDPDAAQFSKSDIRNREIYFQLIRDESILIEKNSLSIALPDQMMGDMEKIDHMIEWLFEIHFKPMDLICGEALHVHIENVLDSVKRNVVDRYVFISFSTRVRLVAPAPRFTAQELEQGILCYDSESTQKAIHEFILNPDGVEHIFGIEGIRLIKKSSDESFLRRKFFMMFRDREAYEECSLAGIIGIFAPGRMDDDVLKFVREEYYDYEKSPTRLRVGNDLSSYYIISRDDGFGDCIAPEATIDGGIIHCETMAEAYRQCIDKLVLEKENVLNGWCTTSSQVMRHYFFFSDGMIALIIQYEKFRPVDVDGMIAELDLRRKFLLGAAEFLRQELCSGESSKDHFSDALREWVYNMIVSDPLAYINPDNGIYSDFAKCLL